MSEILREHTLPGKRKLQLAQGDITQENVDAIVNAANAQLVHGGGLAAAIARAGGAQIRDESRAWIREHGPVEHARPAHTSAGRMPCRYVIHAVGPVWGSGDEDAKLAAAVKGSLQKADELGLASIALPAISTGIFGFPKKRAAGVILQAIGEYFVEHPQSSLALVRLSLYDRPSVRAFLEVWDQRGLGSEQA
jgi:O-acetyl-ADP-ribose deacetylase (regulator of RNase III)